MNMMNMNKINDNAKSEATLSILLLKGKEKYDTNTTKVKEF